MVVIFSGTKLLFADWIFNGHGAGSESFHKQIVRSRKELSEGRNLPNNYKFNDENVRTIPCRRAAWGGHIFRDIKTPVERPDFLQAKTEFLHTTETLSRFV